MYVNQTQFTDNLNTFTNLTNMGFKDENCNNPQVC